MHHARTHKFTCVHVHIHIRTRMHTHTHMHACAHTHICTYEQVTWSRVYIYIIMREMYSICIYIHLQRKRRKGVSYAHMHRSCGHGTVCKEVKVPNGWETFSVKKKEKHFLSKKKKKQFLFLSLPTSCPSPLSLPPHFLWRVSCSININVCSSIVMAVMYEEEDTLYERMHWRWFPVQSISTFIQVLL